MYLLVDCYGKIIIIKDITNDNTRTRKLTHPAITYTIQAKTPPPPLARSQKGFRPFNPLQHIRLRLQVVYIREQ